MTYRMVVSQPVLERDFPVAEFWVEGRRETTRFPGALGRWWTRWRRLSKKRKLVLRDPAMAGMRVEFADEAECHAWLAMLERCEG